MVIDEPHRTSHAPFVRYSQPTNPDRGKRLLRLATDFSFAVQRMGRRNDPPPSDLAEYYPPGDPGDAGPAISGVPLRPMPSPCSASADFDPPAGAEDSGASS
jgi:hypothetical protein